MNTKKLTLAILVLWGSLLVSGSALADTNKNIKNDGFLDCNCNCGYGDIDNSAHGNGIGNGGGNQNGGGSALIVDFVKNHKNDGFLDCNCNCGNGDIDNSAHGKGIWNGGGNRSGGGSALPKICYECVPYEKQPQKAGEHVKLCHRRACKSNDPMTSQQLSNGITFLRLSPNMLESMMRDTKFVGNINSIICREYDSKPRRSFLEPYKPLK